MQNNLSVRLATIDDMERIYLWSNDSITRQNSFHSEPIVWERHKAWFIDKLQSEESTFYIIENKHNPIAFVRFDKKEETIIGITIGREFRGKGFAAICILVACNEYKKHNNDVIFAYIKMDNIPSQRAFLKAGFLHVNETVINGQTSYKLKLST